MIYVTGDTHGELARFSEDGDICKCLKPDDVLIVAGDFGFIWGDYSDEIKLDMLEPLPFTIAFVDGNHECFPKIYSYPEETWHGGRVHRIAANIIHLLRGQVFDIEGMTIFTMGGGFSIDSAFRVPGRSWWSEELPTEAEYDEGLANLKRHGNKVDFIISHAAPFNTMYMFQRSGRIGKLACEEYRLNNYLQLVDDTVEYKQHYFGHLHLDEPAWMRQTALWFHGYCLNTGERVW